MKPGSITIARSVAALAVVASTMIFLSWDVPQQPGVPGTGSSSLNTLELLTPRFANDQDTVPNRNKKIRDIDDAIEELDRVNFDKEIADAMKSVDVAMKSITSAKLQLEVDKALKSVDFDKIQKDVELTLSRIDWDQIKQSINEVKKINFDEIEKEIRKAQNQISIQAPEIKLELEKAKVQIEKAKVQLKEYKTFINGLESDGLINNKQGYTIDHENGEIRINNKKASDATQKKYKSFLDAHQKFHIEIRDGEFNLNDGSNHKDSDNDNDNDNDDDDENITLS